MKNMKWITANLLFAVTGSWTCTLRLTNMEVVSPLFVKEYDPAIHFHVMCSSECTSCIHIQPPAAASCKALPGIELRWCAGSTRELRKPERR